MTLLGAVILCVHRCCPIQSICGLEYLANITRHWLRSQSFLNFINHTRSITNPVAPQGLTFNHIHPNTLHLPENHGLIRNEKLDMDFSICNIPGNTEEQQVFRACMPSVVMYLYWNTPPATFQPPLPARAISPHHCPTCTSVSHNYCASPSSGARLAHIRDEWKFPCWYFCHNDLELQ